MSTRGNKNAVGNKGGRRPTDYRAGFVEIAAKAYEAGFTDAELALCLRVNEDTVTRWKKDHPEFLRVLKMGKEVADDRVERSLYHRAVGYRHQAVKIFMPAGADAPVYAPYTEYVPPDTTACIFWLKNRRPASWRDRHELTGKDGASLLGDKTLEEVRAELVAEFIALGLTADLVLLPEAPKSNGELSNRGVAGRKRSEEG